MTMLIKKVGSLFCWSGGDHYQVVSLCWVHSFDEQKQCEFVILLCDGPDCGGFQHFNELSILHYAFLIFWLVGNDHAIFGHFIVCDEYVTAVYLPVHYEMSVAVGFGDVEEVGFLWVGGMFELDLV